MYVYIYACMHACSMLLHMYILNILLNTSLPACYIQKHSGIVRLIPLGVHLPNKFDYKAYLLGPVATYS